MLKTSCGFYPTEDDFDANAIGLCVQRTPEKTQIRAAAIVPPTPSSKPNPSMENRKNSSFYSRSTKRRVFWHEICHYWCGCCGRLGRNLLLRESIPRKRTIKVYGLAQKRITKNVQEASFDLGAIAGLELNVPAVVETTEDTGVAVEGGQFYSIIAGSFREQSNAERKLEELKAEGFEAAFAETSPDGLIRVAYGRFESKRDAYRLLNFIKYSLEEEAWYLVELHTNYSVYPAFWIDWSGVLKHAKF